MRKFLKSISFSSFFVAMAFLLSPIANAGVIPPASYLGINDDGSELWTLTDANAVYDDSGFEMLFEYGQFNTSDHEFGFYHWDNVNNVVASSLAIFDSSSGVGADSNLVWDLANNQALTTYGIMDLSLASGLDFGFYFQSDGDTFYSQAALNPNGEDLFSFFWETDIFANANLYVYGSDNDVGRNYDYMYVSASDVSPTGGQINTVPEPSTMALFGLALLGFRLKASKKLVKI